MTRSTIPQLAVTNPVASACLLSAFAFGGSAFVLEAQSLVTTTLPWIPLGLSHFIQHVVNWSTPVLFGTVLYRVARSEDPGALLALVGAFTAVAIQRSFRGSYLRLGTFDRFEYDAGTWMTPLIVAGAVALALALFVRHRRSPLPAPKTIASLAFGAGLLAAALAETYFARLGMEGNSVFAPTRHIALLVLGLGALLVASLASKVEP